MKLKTLIRSKYLSLAVVHASLKDMRRLSISIHRIRDYHNAVNEMTSLEPVDSEISKIVVSWVTDDGDNYPSVDCASQDGQEYALDWIPWEEILECEIVVEQKAWYNLNENWGLVFGEILWELTYHGYSRKQIKNSIEF